MSKPAIGEAINIDEANDAAWCLPEPVSRMRFQRNTRRLRGVLPEQWAHLGGKRKPIENRRHLDAKRGVLPNELCVILHKVQQCESSSPGKLHGSIEV
jgi:hypothetical protein